VVQLAENGPTILEVNDYYPFGGRWNAGSSAISDNRFRFSGKEEQSLFGLPYNDFGFRMYDPVIGRWITQDPLAEEYYPFSPYNYCVNNPLRFVDPFGLSIVDEIEHRLWFKDFVNDTKAALDAFVEGCKNGVGSLWGYWGMGSGGGGENRNGRVSMEVRVANRIYRMERNEYVRNSLGIILDRIDYIWEITGETGATGFTTMPSGDYIEEGGRFYKGEQHTPGYFDPNTGMIHLAPYYTWGNVVDFEATFIHEAIHASHHNNNGFKLNTETNRRYSEYVGYTWTMNRYARSGNFARVSEAWANRDRQGTLPADPSWFLFPFVIR
jgi:RHS repeat-associated protein